MAQTDLFVRYNGAGANLYCLIRKQSDYYVWNGTTFVEWDDADIADYDVALSNQGGDIYAVAFPTDIPAGDYLVDYYERAGATPATTDLHLLGERLRWDGEGLTDSSSVTLSTYALTTLTGVKRHLNISSSTYDTKLTELINFASEKIETITGRKFKARNYHQWYNGMGQEKLVLRARPVQHVTRIAYGRANAMTLTYTGSDIQASASVYTDPELYTDNGGLRLVTVDGDGTQTVNNYSFASYPSLSLLAAQVTGGGWTATVLQNMRSANLARTGGEDALNRTVTLTYPDQDIDSYSVDYHRAMVTFERRAGWPWGWDMAYPRGFNRAHQDILIQYRGGYETIPGDVEHLCRELVKEMFQMSTANTVASSWSLGPYSETNSSSSSAGGDQFDERIRSRLSAYIDYANLIGGAA